ncbi:N-acetyltransferase [Paenibacillus psychroresistens]|uniref:N-acetyltransferase n=1 Tax=Paenibacillus psychroresistens TaxID=1778678 RepID=A0A6B8RME3_9BACL|nr:GNAT family protein [Paenibacillus psychroresistens]QGQ96713.1 N-acetyltransferase [Paenibacillus psychroresistens]
MYNLFKEEVVLENNRVKLVPFSKKYEGELRKIIIDEDILFTVNCKTTEDVTHYVEKMLVKRHENVLYPFIIIDKLTHVVAGSTSFGHIHPDNKRLEIGWTWYGRSFRGSGLNKACKFELLKFAFEQMLFRRVQLSADIDNIRSQKAILKLGATREGLFRSNYINELGESRDDVYFSMVHTEWEAIKANNFSEFLLV